MTAVDAYMLLKVASKKEEPALSAPAALGVGTSVGAAAGTGLGLLKNMGNISKVIQLQGKLPELELERTALKSQGLDNRKLLKSILMDKTRRSMLSHDDYYKLRTGYTKGLVNRSRVAKTLKALKGMTRKNILHHGLLGAGAGIGAGLLGATALGHFDKEAFNLNDARKAGKAIAKHRVRAAPMTDDMIGIIPGMMRKPKPSLDKWVPTHEPAVTMPLHMLRPGKATAANAKDIKIFGTGDMGKNITKHVPETKGVLSKMSPNEREIVNRITLLHENAERKAMKNIYREAGTKMTPDGVDFVREGTPLNKLQELSGSHMTPDILAQESNMVATLPKDMTKVREFFTKLRQNDSDAGILKSIQKYAPSFEYGKQRINRHDRKKLMKGLLADV